MLRLTALRRALVSPAPICASAATSAQWVSRILGATNPGATNAKAFGEILTKVPSGKAAVYAHIGRALVFLNRGDDKLAKFDIDNAVKAAGTSGEAALLIASIQYQVAARNLAEEQRKATISGATTEADIMKATEQAKAALDAVVKLAGQDFAASLATAEFSLHSLGDAAASLAHFDAALQLANLHRTSSSSGPGKAEPWAVAAADVEETMSEVTFKSKNISAAKLVADTESLASLRDTLSASSLSDEEVTLLGSVFALSARGGTVFDAVRCNSEDFSPAPFRHAQSVVRRVAQLTHPLIEEHHFHAHKPSKAFFKEGVSIAGLVKDCPKDVHILDFVEQKAGKVPQTALSAQDKDFFTELDRIAHATADHVPTAPAAAQSFYNSLGTDLMEQVIFRAKVGRAEALLALKKAAEADALVTEVIQSQRYVDHWRALLVKGRTARALGKVDEAEAAFGELHGLKRQVGHNDIPLMDNNRYKSAF